jgi:hypothetical protein
MQTTSPMEFEALITRWIQAVHREGGAAFRKSVGPNFSFKWGGEELFGERGVKEFAQHCDMLKGAKYRTLGYGQSVSPPYGGLSLREEVIRQHGGASVSTLSCWKLNWQRLETGWKLIGVTKIRESQLPGTPQLCIAEGMPQVGLPPRRPNLR